MVQCLFTFIIAAELTAITFLANGINFVDKDDTWSFFLCLFEQVTHTCGTHANEHFDKFGTGDGEERYLRFAGYCFCEQRLTCTRRAYKQSTLRHISTNFSVFIRIMQEVDQFLQCFLSLILPGDIGKTFAGLGLYIDLGVTLTKAHRIAAAHPITHETHEQLSYNEENKDRQDPVREEVADWRTFLRDYLREFYLALHQAVDQIRILDTAGHVNSFICFVFSDYRNFIRSYFNFGYLTFINLLQEITIGNFLYLRAEVHRCDNRVEEINNQNRYQVVIN